MDFTNRQRMELFFSIAAGGTRLKLLESIITLRLSELIQNGSLTAEEIITALNLSPLRAKKWLYLLCMENFLIEENYAYRLGPILTALFEEPQKWQYFSNVITRLQSAAVDDLSAILKGNTPTYQADWPPASEAASLTIEKRMKANINAVIAALENHLPPETKTVLDVGGGDATLVCHFAHKNPSMHFTVYNLPEGAKLASNKIAQENLSQKIDVIDGDFLKDSAFPAGYDVILFTRVLCNWPVEICQKLLKMAFEALNEKGTIIICESFKELNDNLILMREYHNIFWDKFGIALFKDSATYSKILEKIGFQDCEFSEANDAGVYRVLKARKE